FTKDSSTVTLSGAAKTLRTRDASNGFHNLTISGTVTQNNATDVDGTLAIDGSLTTSGNDITGGASLLVAGGGTLTAGGSTITIRSIDTSAGAFAAGTSTLVVNASGGSIRIPQPIFSLTVTSGVSTTFSSNVTWSGALTETGYGITFNRLSVVGTIADSSVSVSTLTVTNSDGSALITITAFGDWTAGASYAWTHSSTETTQTITWTIGGNTARFPFTV